MSHFSNASTVSLSAKMSAHIIEGAILFLGLLGYDEETDDFVIASKSTTTGDYAGYFKNLLFDKINGKEEDLKRYLRDTNTCMAFEVIDIKNDPHIIEYDDSEVILLDVIDSLF